MKNVRAVIASFVGVVLMASVIFLVGSPAGVAQGAEPLCAGASRRLRAIPAYAQVPIIAMTALAMPGDRERCMDAGANEYMTKPVSLRALAERIRQLLDA
ncbi:MAG: response regulator [Chloroflexales bacterium]